MDIRALYWLGRGVATVQSETYFSWCGWFASKIFSKHFEKSTLPRQWRRSLCLTPFPCALFVAPSLQPYSLFLSLSLFPFLLLSTIPRCTMKRSGVSLSLAVPDEKDSKCAPWFISMFRSSRILRIPSRLIGK